jgi:hypothetical protein
MLATFKHLTAYFGERTKATRIGARIERDVAEGGDSDGAARTSVIMTRRS